MRPGSLISSLSYLFRSSPNSGAELGVTTVVQSMRVKLTMGVGGVGSRLATLSNSASAASTCFAARHLPTVTTDKESKQSHQRHALTDGANIHER